jgi:hypothetical protein
MMPLRVKIKEKNIMIKPEKIRISDSDAQEEIICLEYLITFEFC